MIRDGFKAQLCCGPLNRSSLGFALLAALCTVWPATPAHPAESDFKWKIINNRGWL